MSDLPIQQSLTTPFPSTTDYITSPRLGIVLQVRCADDPSNRSAKQYQSFRGAVAEATVYLVDTNTVLPNVIITPDIASGMDDFYEKFPRQAQKNTTGREYSLQDWENLDPSDLDGDWCVVDFLNGKMNQPYVQRWWPSPRNFYDNATSGKGNPILGVGKGRALKQKNRHFRRTNGVEYVVTPEGDVWFSTKMAGSELDAANQGSNTDRVKRKSSKGGSVLLQMNPKAELDITFDDNPDGVGPGMVYSEYLPQKNPNALGASPVASSNTSASFNRSSIKVKVPVNFTVEAKVKARAEAGVAVELNAPRMQLGDNAVQPAALAGDTLKAIARIETFLVGMDTAITAALASVPPSTDPVFQVWITALQTSLKALAFPGTLTQSVAAKKVFVE